MKRHALLVGGFVLLAALLAVAAVLWLSGNRLFSDEIRAVIHFQGSVNGLYVGAPVTFRGVAVGQVEEIGIEVDGRTLQARIPVRVRLRPEVLRVSDEDALRAPLKLSTLVQRGLRADLVAQSFVTGQKIVDLDFKPDTPARLVGDGSLPEIPAVADRFDALIEQVAQLPLRETVEELRGTLQALQQTLASTQGTLDATARELGATAGDVRRALAVATETMREVQGSTERTLGAVTALAETSRGAVQTAQPELQRGLESARLAADSAREAADSARLAMQRVAEMTAPGASLRGDLDGAVRDLSQAARGLREWAEVLEERPNAVIFGDDRR